jgi:hypothetical protein
MDLAKSPLSTSEQARAAIVTYVEKGVPLADACGALGVPRRTFTFWRNLGVREIERCQKEGVDPEPHLAPYVEFVEDLDLAHSKGIVRHIERLDKAAEDPDNWKALTWLLGRMDQRTFLWTSPPKDEVGSSKHYDQRSTSHERLDEISARRQAYRRDLAIRSGLELIVSLSVRLAGRREEARRDRPGDNVGARGTGSSRAEESDLLESSVHPAAVEAGRGGGGREVTKVEDGSTTISSGLLRRPRR